jgi:hypothetical protein
MDWKEQSYVGIEKLNVQAMLTGNVVNLKRFVKMSCDNCGRLC